MAINNFVRIEIGPGSELIVHGETHDPTTGKPMNIGPDARIYVAVISVGNEDLRASPEVIDPSTSPWEARTNVHHFNAGNEVFAVGAAFEGHANTPFLWADQFTIDS